jgi:hypothetical protein
MGATVVGDATVYALVGGLHGSDQLLSSGPLLGVRRPQGNPVSGLHTLGERVNLGFQPV